MPLASPRQVFEALQQRIRAIMARHTTREAVCGVAMDPRFVRRVAKELAIQDESDVGRVVRKCIDVGDDGSRNQQVEAATLLALCGWQPAPCDGVTATAAVDGASAFWCEYCNRSVALQPNSPVGPASREEEDGARVTKKPRVAPQQPLDPLSEHRWFCPWLVDQVQSADRDAAIARAAELTGWNDDAVEAFLRLPGWRQSTQVSTCLVAR